MPEEVNRVVTDRLGNYLFASSPDAVANLRAEGYRDDKIYLAVRVIPPARYLDFIALQASTRLVLTDSGGVQEESTVLGVPCLTLRANTERPITLAEGKNHLVGREPDRIVAAARQVLASPPAHRCPVLWAGHAGERIAAALLSANVKERLRQTAIPCGPTLIPAAPVLGT
jgi:UDP-N-acetylglucosamine 2-epimerase